MVTLEKFVRPDLPEGRSTELSEGKIMGWVPGEITALEDPERLGRVRVRCDIIQQDIDLPNSNDGFCWVMEEFVTNAAAGGAHRLLKVGTQVAMLPMLGDPRQMLLLGCIPSRVDRPSPEFNRAEEIYGSHTPGQVYDVNNDADGSWINTRPNGVLEHISGEGDRTTQTRDGGRIQVKADGTVRTENPKAATTIAPEGTIQTQNEAGGLSTLNKDGEWELKAATQAALSLKSDNALMTGPAGKLSQLTKDLKSNLAGTLDLGQQLLRQTQVLASGLRDGGDPEMLLNALAPLIGDIEKILKGNIPQALSTISGFQDNSGEIIEHLEDQVQNFFDSGLSSATQVVGQVLKEFPGDIQGALSKLTESLAPELATKLKPENLTPTLIALSHDVGMQEQLLLEAIAPGDFGSFQNLVGLDLHGKVGDIQSLFDQTSATYDEILGSVPSQLGELDLQNLFTQAEGELAGLLPKNLQSLISNPDIKQIVQLAVTGGNPMSLLLGSAASGLVGDLSSHLEGIGINLPQVEAIASVIANPTDISKLTEVFGLGEVNPVEVIDKVLPDALDSVGNVLGGLFGGGKKKTNKLLNGLGTSKGGAVVKALKNKVEAYADASLLGAKLEISKPKAALKGIGGVEVFAGKASAGIKTPFGTFDLGAGGGNLLTQGTMAFKVLQDIGKVAGLVLDKDSGISLSSFADPDSTAPTANVSVDEGIVDIAAGNSSVRVSPDGVFLEGYRVIDYLDEFTFFRDLATTHLEQLDLYSTNQAEAIADLSNRLSLLESIKLYRCTRNSMYPDTPVDERLAIYLRASSVAEVASELERLFPEEVAGFTIDPTTLL